jgi:glycosyltransferase involved in cell wall biosynthesis
VTGDPATTSTWHHLVVGPARHGVTRYAELLLRAADVPATRVTRIDRTVTAADAADLVVTLPPAPVPVHLHLTDHLLGGPEDTPVVVAALAVGRPVVVTLHDLPQPSDGAPLPRRRACYAAVARTATAVVVSSAHEERLLRDVLAAVPDPAGRTVRVRVVPLAADLPRDTSVGGDRTDDAARSRDVAVLGFVYPGKGHDEVLSALEHLPADVGLRVLGGASPGHEDLLDGLAARAHAMGRRLTVDGWVADEDLPRLLDEVAVPVVAPRHVSASASLASWLAAGRRPVATRNDYSAEVDRAHPGCLLLVDDDPAALAAGLRTALADPSSTRLVGAAGTDPAEAAALTFDRYLLGLDLARGRGAA